MVLQIILELICCKKNLMVDLFQELIMLIGPQYAVIWHHWTIVVGVTRRNHLIVRTAYNKLFVSKLTARVPKNNVFGTDCLV